MSFLHKVDTKVNFFNLKSQILNCNFKTLFIILFTHSAYCTLYIFTRFRSETPLYTRAATVRHEKCAAFLTYQFTYKVKLHLYGALISVFLPVCLSVYTIIQKNLKLEHIVVYVTSSNKLNNWALRSLISVWENCRKMKFRTYNFSAIDKQNVFILSRLGSFVACSKSL